MFRARGYGGAGASARYRDIDVASRVEGATPHGLVAILFDELLKALEMLIVHQRQGDLARRNERQARALSILHGLEASLDFDRGGEIANSLSQIYREARRLIALGVRDGDVAPIEQARAMLADIAGAWTSIG
ncbi:flagellar export chaperone FliS [Sphingomonas oleivorans]|uniref:Flagellar export chaperone FliS n=1 Tax=Sphingomonas oleivorans TaxID=1735121 RepID=A0A2T5FYG5_9SPHN|nr:flagellar protein FliS [Sphingomonas oleivorans]PTQ11534.1 flagellar export chaperone FliS [Sphingomonas oleivorans]